MIGALIAVCLEVLYPQVQQTPLRKVSPISGVSASVPSGAKALTGAQLNRTTEAIGFDPTSAGIYFYVEGKVAYEVGEFQPRSSQAIPEPTEQVLANYIAGLLTVGNDPEILKQRDILLNGWPGLEVLAKLNAEKNLVAVIWTRTFFVKDRIYSAAVSYPIGAGRPPLAEAFLNSVTVDDAATPGPFSSPGPVFQTFEPRGEGYSISMPSKAVEWVESGAPAGQTKLKRFRASYGNRSYVVAHIDLPEEARDQEPGPSVVEMLIDKFDGEITKPTKPVTRDGTTFESAEFRTPEKMAGRIDVTMVGLRAFVILMLYPTGHAGSPDINTFFNSFRILKADPAKK